MAASSSALFRLLICPKGSRFHRRGVRTATTAVRNQDSSSPWLMLSPGDTTSYNFYSLAEKKVVQTPSSPSDVIGRPRCRGSSHGWLALLSPDNDGFFLYNPISRRHIKLPSILNLPASPDDDDIHSSRRYVIKVILSSSPEEESCRAVLVRGCSNPLAFCCPSSSKDWTLMLDGNIGGHKTSYYEDCVYSTRRKLFFGLTKDRSVETWDLRDPSSPRLIKTIDVKTIIYHYQYYDYASFVRYAIGDQKQHLVVAEQDLLFVNQYITYYVGPDGSSFTYVDESRADNYRYMTIGFDIYKYDPKKRGLKYVDGSSLGGLALFVGMHSHSVAIPATRFPELQPNSIYFTDPCYTGRFAEDEDEPFSGYDIGIFNYENKTVSPCYYPCDVGSLKKILPAPIWFFPSRPI